MVDFRIEELTPRFLMEDRNGRAMARAIEAGLRAMCGVIAKSAAEAIDIDEMPEWRLDELAREMDVPWYITDAEIEAKRAAIRDAYQAQARIGTRWAVEHIAKRFFVDAIIDEWWAYGAEPYHFRARTPAVQEGTRGARDFAEVVERTKNTRSVLDGVLIEMTMPGGAMCAAALLQYAQIIKMGMKGA